MIWPYLWLYTSCKIFCSMAAIFTAEKPLIIITLRNPLWVYHFWEFSNTYENGLLWISKITLDFKNKSFYMWRFIFTWWLKLSHEFLCHSKSMFCNLMANVTVIRCSLWRVTGLCMSAKAAPVSNTTLTWSF